MITQFLIATTFFIIYQFTSGYVRAYFTSRRIRDAKGNRLPFLTPFPKIPLGDSLALLARERLPNMRNDPSFRPQPIRGVFMFANPTVIVTDPELIQKVFFKNGEVYGPRPGSEPFIRVLRLLHGAWTAVKMQLIVEFKPRRWCCRLAKTGGDCMVCFPRLLPRV